MKESSIHSIINRGYHSLSQHALLTTGPRADLPTNSSFRRSPSFIRTIPYIRCIPHYLDCKTGYKMVRPVLGPFLGAAVIWDGPASHGAPWVSPAVWVLGLLQVNLRYARQNGPPGISLLSPGLHFTRMHPQVARALVNRRVLTVGYRCYWGVPPKLHPWCRGQSVPLRQGWHRDSNPCWSSCSQRCRKKG